ncbi:MAG: helix-turn-helix domain-containing protein [Candidatus Aminicenantes bacterium]|nr:MAG: helix-turn-helix domain-containing protein [Candidatus Aminicenantes bacterium]
MDKLITVREAAGYLLIHPQTLYKWRKQGKIPYSKINGQIRFKKENINDLLEKSSYRPSQIFDILPQPEKELDISLAEYDKRFLRSQRVNNKMARWRYSDGIVYQIKNQGGSKSWGIEYRDENGKRKQRIVPNAQSREDAMIALHKKVREVFDLQNCIAKPKRIGFCEYSDLYLQDYAMVAKESGKTDEYRLKRIREFFKVIDDLRDIKPLMIQKFRAVRLEEGVSKVTTNREIQLLKKMFNVAIEENYLEENPAKKIKLYSELDTVRDRVLSEEEEPRLFNELAEHVRPFVFVALHTGMRKGELLKLKWQNVDFEKRQIKVEKTKSKKVRFIPINSVLFDELSKLKLKRGKEQRVFPFKYTQTAWENARRRAGLDDLTFHDLRRTFGTRLLEAGVDIVTISKLYGHSSVLVTQRYLHPKDKLSREAVEALVKKPDEKSKNEEKLLDICETKKEERLKNFAIHSFSMN